MWKLNPKIVHEGEELRKRSVAFLKKSKAGLEQRGNSELNNFFK